MVLSFNINHIFTHPVDAVIKAFISQINNNPNGEVSQVVLTKDEPSDMECVTYKSTWDNFFPSFFQRLGLFEKNTITFDKEVWSDWSNKRHWIRSRNVTWEDSEVGRVVYLSEDETHRDWTKWEETYVVNFASFGTLGRALEMYLKRKLKLRSHQEIESIEVAIKACD